MCSSSTLTSAKTLVFVRPNTWGTPFFQMAVQGCAAGTGAVPWSRAAGVASARLDGVGLDAALSWKLTAVMEQTTTEVKF